MPQGFFFRTAQLPPRGRRRLNSRCEQVAGLRHAAPGPDGGQQVPAPGGTGPPWSLPALGPGRPPPRSLGRPGPLAAAPARGSSTPAAAAAASGPRGPAPAPEVVAGGAEHAGMLAGQRGRSRRLGIHPSRYQTFRSAILRDV